VIVDESVSGFDPAALALYLATKNIETRPIWKPMHLQPLFSGAPSLIDGSSEHLFLTGLALPSGSGMSDSELSRIADSVSAFLERWR
jgi:dTDP-4-amino-4,6-dideoxygalactose transaminase